jgi:hypothetical protein
MLIRIADMKGRIPKMHPRLLPQTFAQVAKNTRLEDGAIGPMKKETSVHSFAEPPSTFIKFNGSFVGFDQANVNATAGPVAQDRLYYTGVGTPKMRAGGTDYDLEVRAPSNQLAVTLKEQTTGDTPSLSTTKVTDPGAIIAIPYQFRYSAITAAGETAASPLAQVTRIDGQYVIMSGLSLPTGTTAIRIYRNDLNITGNGFAKVDEIQYRDSTHGPLNNAQIVDTFAHRPAYNIQPRTTDEVPGESVGGAPTLALETVTSPGNFVDESFSYRYSAITDRGETGASPFATIDRIDGERVNITGMSLPEGTETIRIYRRDNTKASGASGRFGKLFDVTYDQATHGPLSDASTTDLFTAFPDITMPPSEVTDEVDEREFVTYIYTYVTSFDEESAPSPASDLIKVGKTDDVTFTFSAPTQTERNIDRVRVYRSKTSLGGVTDFYFLRELNVSVAGNTQKDDFQNLLNEPLPSADYDTPPADMKGLIPLPNGLMAAHTGRELLFCEPYKPHAWPIKYRMTTDTNIVGLGAFGTFIVVLTEGSPFMVQGSEPDLMVMEKLEVTLPCTSALSIVDMGYSVAYASIEGLVTVSQSGAQVVTQNLFTPEQWRALAPDSIVATQRNGRYHFGYQAIPGGARALGIIDLTNQQPFYIEADIQPALFYFDAPNGAIYFTDGGGEVKEFDPRGGAVVAKQQWKSKLTILQGYDNFGAILIEADSVPGDKAIPADPDCVTRVYADGNLVHTITSTNLAQRLPSGFLANTWEVEVEGYAPVTGISLASDIAEFVGN